MIGTVDAIAELSTDTVIVRAIGIYAAVVRGKEFAGQERAAGARGLVRSIQRDRPARLRGARGVQEQQFEWSAARAPTTQQDALKAVLASAASAEVTRMRDAAIALATGEIKNAVAAPDWFKASTARIDGLKKVEDRVAGDLKSVAGGASSTGASR